MQRYRLRAGRLSLEGIRPDSIEVSRLSSPGPVSYQNSTALAGSKLEPRTAPGHIPIWVYNVGMARAATTADAFNAVAEPRRRQILDVLAGGERPVNDLVKLIGLAQPQVSKHLRVLREVGLVEVRGEGRQRIYRLNGQPLKPIHDWVKDYERTWEERFEALDELLEQLKAKEEADGSGDE